jgi:hypothetical protein
MEQSDVLEREGELARWLLFLPSEVLRRRELYFSFSLPSLTLTTDTDWLPSHAYTHACLFSNANTARTSSFTDWVPISDTDTDTDTAVANPNTPSVSTSEPDSNPHSDANTRVPFAKSLTFSYTNTGVSYPNTALTSCPHASLSITHPHAYTYTDSHSSPSFSNPYATHSDTRLSNPYSSSSPS